MSLGCSRTNSTTSSRMRATELAVEATMERAGMPSGELGSLSATRENTVNTGTHTHPSPDPVSRSISVSLNQEDCRLVFQKVN